jgi:hypothetical protein
MAVSVRAINGSMSSAAAAGMAKFRIFCPVLVFVVAVPAVESPLLGGDSDVPFLPPPSSKSPSEDGPEGSIMADRKALERQLDDVGRCGRRLADVRRESGGDNRVALAQPLRNTQHCDRNERPFFEVDARKKQIAIGDNNLFFICAQTICSPWLLLVFLRS